MMLASAIMSLKKGDTLYSNYVAFASMDNPGTAKVLGTPKTDAGGSPCVRIRLGYGGKAEMYLDEATCFAWRSTVEPEEVVHVPHRVHRASRHDVKQPTVVHRVPREAPVARAKPVVDEKAKPVVRIVKRSAPAPKAATLPEDRDKAALAKVMLRLSRIKGG